MYHLLALKLPADIVDGLRERLDGRHVCVTGGAGFIGGHLVDALLAVGASVTVIDDLSSSTLEHLASLVEIEPDRVRVIQGSILDDEALDEAIGGAQFVFHLAALGSVPLSIEHPQRAFAVNATGTLRVLEAARETGVERVVYAASSSAYGDSPSLPKRETDLPAPMSPYAASKLAGEHLLATWSSVYGLSTVSLRFFNIFGPRQSAESAYAAVVAAFAKALLAGEAPVIFGDGSQSRDFTFVANAVLALLLAAACEEDPRGRVFNVGTGVRTSVSDLARMMARGLGLDHVQPIHRDPRAGDVPHSLADVSLATRVLGYRVVTDVQSGLDETIQWFGTALADA